VRPKAWQRGAKMVGVSRKTMEVRRTGDATHQKNKQHGILADKYMDLTSENSNLQKKDNMPTHMQFVPRNISVTCSNRDSPSDCLPKRLVEHPSPKDILEAVLPETQGFHQYKMGGVLGPWPICCFFSI